MQTDKRDWGFIIPATLIWIVALSVTLWEWLWLRKGHLALKPLRRGALVAMIVGVGIRLRARYVLGRFFSYALRIRPDHQLMTHDIYRWVRHPAYTGDMLFHFGLTLFLGSLRGFSFMLLLIPCFIYRIGVEENLLVRKFGKHYQAYQQHTKKLLPRIY